MPSDKTKFGGGGGRPRPLSGAIVGGNENESSNNDVKRLQFSLIISVSKVYGGKESRAVLLMCVSYRYNYIFIAKDRLCTPLAYHHNAQSN